MNKQALLPLLAVLMTGCWTSFDISPAQVPHVASGKVRDLRDAEREVRKEYEVWAHPQEDVVFMIAPRSDLAIAVPGWDEAREAARGLVRVLPAGKSVDQPSVDVTRITGPRGTFVIPNASIQRIEIQQFSPVKTAFVVTGSVPRHGRRRRDPRRPRGPRRANVPVSVPGLAPVRVGSCTLRTGAGRRHL